ncbi:hypothetical protein PR048_011140 [Dryococelus australis]|uniref:Uncharacterized protein n=1 Tax=Dryococelus australis TaxID=614101 RepID=A0ABQ9HKR2_9NEOP|nr:hypothetical protein PR048_011140 [Dryococelus australis]
MEDVHKFHATTSGSWVFLLHNYSSIFNKNVTCFRCAGLKCQKCGKIGNVANLGNKGSRHCCDPRKLLMQILLTVLQLIWGSFTCSSPTECGFLILPRCPYQITLL